MSMSGEVLAATAGGDIPPEPAALVLQGKYRVDGLIGQGGMGSVYIGTQEPLGRTIAIKVLAARQIDPTFRERFFLEASTSAKLVSPHIVTIHDFGETPDGKLFIVMEHVDGVTLDAVMKQEGALPASRIIPIVRQVCEALTLAHDAGVIHRDLKPTNIMVVRGRDDEEQVKVLDFGLAKSFTKDSDDPDLTQEGTVIGSPFYMAPEQINRSRIDQRTDVYAVGVLIYRMLSGRHPFEAGSAIEIMAKHLNEPAPDLARGLPSNNDFARRLAAIAMRCLAKNPEHRFASMDDLSGALEQLEQSAVPFLPVLANVSHTASDFYSAFDPTKLTDEEVAEEIKPVVSDVDDQTIPLRMDSLTTIEESQSILVEPALLVPPDAEIGQLHSTRGPANYRVLLLGIVAGALLVAGAMALDRPPPRKAAAETALAPAKFQLALKSEPAGALVKVGERVIGRTPLVYESDHSEAKLNVHFEKAGFFSLVREVKLDQPRQSVRVKMVPTD